MDHEPMMIRIDDVKSMLGLGTTKVYELIGQGLLDARKVGKRTLVTRESMRTYIAGLPKATVGQGENFGRKSA